MSDCLFCKIIKGDIPSNKVYEDELCFAENDAQRDEIIAGMRQRGIRDIVVTAHVEGDLLKFYGVAGSGFFRYFYPADDGEWKFKSEQHNGRSQHYEFDTRQLQQDALRLSELIGAEIFGGDCARQSALMYHDGLRFGAPEAGAFVFYQRRDT